jgi:hypothetical protein
MERAVMTETTNKMPVKTEMTSASPPARRRFEGVRREIDSLGEDFFGRRPSSTRRGSFLNIASRRARAAFGAIPAVHLNETDRAYDITSELPGGINEKPRNCCSIANAGRREDRQYHFLRDYRLNGPG